jgi:hypothetical protein
LIPSFDKDAAHAYVLADGLKFACRSAQWEAQTHRELEVETAILPRYWMAVGATLIMGH